MTPGTPVRVARHLAGRQHMAAYVGRRGAVIAPFTALYPGFVAVVLQPPASVPCAFAWRMVFHVDELDVVAKEAR